MKGAADGRRPPVSIFTGRYLLSPTLKKKILTLSKRIIKNERKRLNANLIFIGDAKMKELNRKFRGKDKTTDVLSFPIEANGRKVEGEIYISLPQAKRQAPLLGTRSRERFCALRRTVFCIFWDTTITPLRKEAKCSPVRKSI